MDIPALRQQTHPVRIVRMMVSMLPEPVTVVTFLAWGGGGCRGPAVCSVLVEKSRAPRPYYVDHHEAVSHQDVTTDYLAQDTKGSVIITVSWFPGLPCK